MLGIICFSGSLYFLAIEKHLHLSFELPQLFFLITPIGGMFFILGWMLLADFGKPVGWDAPIAVRAAVLRGFARLQIASATKIDELLTIGCIDRRLPKLAEQIDPLFADAEMMTFVSPETQQQLLTAAPKLKASISNSCAPSERGLKRLRRIPLGTTLALPLTTIRWRMKFSLALSQTIATKEVRTSEMRYKSSRRN